ncbi:MAG: hypothetical protein ACK5RG_18945 [Cyclobacteriaceae bacterium]|jgi:hypothetical protein|nr:hypothetical protein [Flammeovirgaceae bacterium]
MRRCVIVLGLYLMPACIFAQVSMEEFLGAAFQSQRLLTLGQQQSFLQTRPYQLAPIRKLAFQTTSNQLDRTRQDYSFRVLPSNPWEVRNTNNYFKTYSELITIDQERQLREALRERYLLIIEWGYWDEIHRLKEEEKMNTQKLLSIMEAQRLSSNFNPEEYVQLKLDQVDQTIELEEMAFNRDALQKKIEALYETAKQKSIGWTGASLMTVEKIEEFTNRARQEGSTTGSELAYYEKQIELAMRKWHLEKSNINVGFIQTQYEPFREESNRRPWSISMGLTIPIFNPNKGDMAQRKLQVIEAQGVFEQTKLNQRIGKDFSYEKIMNLLLRYKEVAKMTTDLNFGDLALTMQQMKSNNPTTVVKLQNRSLRLKVLTARLKREILNSYIDFLAFSDLLQQKPVINYLSPSLAVIERK